MPGRSVIVVGAGVMGAAAAWQLSLGFTMYILFELTIVAIRRSGR